MGNGHNGKYSICHCIQTLKSELCGPQVTSIQPAIEVAWTEFVVVFLNIRCFTDFLSPSSQLRKLHYMTASFNASFRAASNYSTFLFVKVGQVTHTVLIHGLQSTLDSFVGC